MAYRTVRVIRYDGDAEVPLFSTTLNEDEDVKVRKDKRPDQIAENNPGIEKANTIEDVVVVVGQPPKSAGG